MRNSRMEITRRRRWSSLLVSTLALSIFLAAAGEQAQANLVSSTDKDEQPIVPEGRYYSRDRDAPGGAEQNTSVTLYKEPSGWLVNILKEMFNDIDWAAIDNARVQIEKFIHKVDRIVGSFRSIINKATGGSGGGGGGTSSTPAERSPDGRWWTSGDKGASKGDTTNVKEMLERVACFVGYVRLMNLSNEALAELDASKVVSNLFGNSAAGSGAKRNSSMWTWFG